MTGFPSGGSWIVPDAQASLSCWPPSNAVEDAATTAMRSDRGDTTNGPAATSRASASAAFSETPGPPSSLPGSPGPGSTRTDHVAGPGGSERGCASRAALTRGGASTEAARPSTSPVCNVWPPSPARRSEDADPSATGASKPPARETYARAPSFAGPSRSSSPGNNSVVATTGAGTVEPSARCTTPPQSAPARPTAQGATHLTRKPPAATSSAGVPGALPTTAFATRKACSSAAPDRDTPWRAWPTRPKSCKDDWTPPAATSSTGSLGAGNKGGGGGGGAAAASVSTKRTRSPGRRSAGGSRAGSKSGAAVRPRRCQPPGVSRV
mmetsp:Transcript_16575/g.51589  ORF Transcript_16575/g.51589 Transcript_16575/m.51589 type:complete len:324 (-) Transcript_16575:2032-3003(-)